MTVTDVSFSKTIVTGAHLAVSLNGSLAYVSGELYRPNALVWVDPDGAEEPLPIETKTYSHVELSPDGTRLALDVAFGPEPQDIWTYDLDGKTLSRFTFGEEVDNYPVWTPDGRRIIFTRDDQGVFWKAADGTGVAEQLTSPGGFVADVSPDGKHAFFYRNEPETLFDIYRLSLEDDHTVEPLLQTPFDERRPALSPDGRWMAYQSDESGRIEIYIRPYPDVNGGKWQVSVDGGWTPMWAPNGEALYYRRGSAMMMAQIGTEPTISVGTRQVLFAGDGRYLSESSGQHAITPDGQRLLLIRHGSVDDNTPSAEPTIHVVLNWFSDLQARVPTGR